MPQFPTGACDDSRFLRILDGVMNATALAQVHADNASTGPEYEGPEGIARRFSIGRSTVFELLRAGKIKSVSLKTHPGNVRGRRLCSVASAREFFATLATN